MLQAFESRALELSDFHFTGDDYRYRFEREARQRFIDLIRERFNSGVNYGGRNLKWDTVIEQKIGELGRVLINKSHTFHFEEPSPTFVRYDDRELRARVLATTQSEASELGIGKSTLHYLHKKALNDRAFKLYRPIQRKLLNHVEIE